MKIIVIGNFGVAWDGSVCDEKNISGALTNLGHEVVEVSRDDVIIPYPGDVNLIIISQYGGYPEHVCNLLRERYKCPVVYWAFDFNKDDPWHFEMAKDADVFLAADYGRKAMYDEMGVNFVWFPQAFAPDFLEVSDVEGEEYDVTFTGSLGAEQDGRRSEVLKAVDEKFDLHIFTTTPQAFEGFKNVHPAAVDEALSVVVAKSKINLSVDSWHVDGSWSDRNAQIMACGGFCLFKHIPLSTNFFQDGVEYFQTTEECLDKIQYFLDHPLSRTLTATKGMMMADGLKVTNRVRMMLEEVRGAL